MKLFEEYIREAVDFRLGGSQKKGFVAPKTFEELEEGDIVYTVQTFRGSIVLKKKEKFHSINLDPENCYIVFQEGNSTSFMPFDLDSISDTLCVTRSDIYSTYELSDAEASKLAKRQYRNRRKKK